MPGRITSEGVHKIIMPAVLIVAGYDHGACRYVKVIKINKGGIKNND